GIRLINKLWLEGGYFRTHLGFESIQPRENIGSTIALTTYYEPYYLSGAKLTYYANEKLSLQLNAFNGFNTFVAINKKKSVGFTAVYELRKNFVMSYNCLISDNTPDSIATSHLRLYNDFYLAYKSKRFNFGFEVNFGLQENTGIVDSSKMAKMFSMTIAGKYKIKNDKYSIYARAEIFNDPDEILTGPVNNANHQLVGINALGLNAGLEFKPMPNAYLRFEGRYLHLLRDETIFYSGGNTYTNVRKEFVSALGFWF
ncbi:MAG TPA: outer membrane beta-barrel protein, partial [Bacteroidia bacterium]